VRIDFNSNDLNDLKSNFDISDKKHSAAVEKDNCGKMRKSHGKR